MLWLLALTIVLLPSYLIRFSVLGIPSTILEILIYFSVVWLLVSQPFEKTKERLQPTLRKYGLPIVLFTLSALVSALIAPDKRAAFGLLKAYVIDPVLFFLVIAATKSNRKIEMVIAALIGSGLLVALSAFLLPETPEGRALGIYHLDPTASPNFLALFLAPLASLSLITTLRTQSYYRIFSLVSFLAMLVALILSGSRGGLFAVGIGVGIIVFNTLMGSVKHQWRGVVRGTAIGLIFLALVAGVVVAKPDLTAKPSHRVATSNNLRYEIWRTTVVDILPDHPLEGVGLGNYQDYFREKTKYRVNFPEFISPWALTPHNIFLTIWTNLGLVGLIAFIWLLVLFFRNQSSIQLALSVTAITLLVHGLVDASYWKNDLAVLFWIILAISVSATSEVDHG